MKFQANKLVGWCVILTIPGICGMLIDLAYGGACEERDDCVRPIGMIAGGVVLIEIVMVVGMIWATSEHFGKRFWSLIFGGGIGVGVPLIFTFVGNICYSRYSSWCVWPWVLCITISSTTILLAMLWCVKTKNKFIPRVFEQPNLAYELKQRKYADELWFRV